MTELQRFTGPYASITVGSYQPLVLRWWSAVQTRTLARVAAQREVAASDRALAAEVPSPAPSANLPASFLIGALLENPKLASQLVDGVPPITLFQQLTSQYPALAAVDARAIDVAARQGSGARGGVLVRPVAGNAETPHQKPGARGAGVPESGGPALPISVEPRVSVGLDAA